MVSDAVSPQSSALSPLSLSLSHILFLLLMLGGVAVKGSLDAGACKLFTATSRQQFSQANKASEGCRKRYIGIGIGRGIGYAYAYRYRRRLIDRALSYRVAGAKRTSSLPLCVHQSGSYRNQQTERYSILLRGLPKSVCGTCSNVRKVASS